MSNKNKSSILERFFVSLLAIYIFIVSIAQLGNALMIWPVLFYILLCVFAVYVTVLVNKHRLDKVSRSLLLVEAILATALVFPRAVGTVADTIGVRCEDLLGGHVNCSESSLLSIELAILLLVPMLIIAIAFCLRTKKL